MRRQTSILSSRDFFSVQYLLPATTHEGSTNRVRWLEIRTVRRVELGEERDVGMDGWNMAGPHMSRLARPLSGRRPVHVFGALRPGALPSSGVLFSRNPSRVYEGLSQT